MTLTSDEVNFLIYRYLLESGFVHSAFCFGNESHIAKSKIVGGDVPPGSLISFLQKGLQHTEIECHVNDDGTETQCDAPFSLIAKHECSIKSKTKLFDPDVPMDEDYGSLEIAREAISHYRAHSDIVFACAVSPDGDKLVSGSQDGTARLWQQIGDPANARCANLFDKQPAAVAIHLAQWSSNGNLFAVASLAGDAWIFTFDGLSRFHLVLHSSPITAIRWSPEGQRLLTCSLDAAVAVWHPSTGQLLQQWRFAAGVLDADWQSGSAFVVGVLDQAAYLCELDAEEPLAAFRKHTGDVNCVKWDPTGTLFATCSDDTTVKVWNPLTPETLVFDLCGHGRDVCSIVWATITHERRPVPVLASASFDCTIRIWNATNGACLLVLSKHLHPVTSLSFNRSGSYLACVSHDRVFIWSTVDGMLLKTYKAGGGVNCISWMPNAESFVIATANNALINVQLRS